MDIYRIWVWTSPTCSTLPNEIHLMPWTIYCPPLSSFNNSWTILTCKDFSSNSKCVKDYPNMSSNLFKRLNLQRIRIWQKRPPNAVNYKYIIKGRLKYFYGVLLFFIQILVKLGLIMYNILIILRFNHI